jgi:nitrate/TMAO reductase-like tetraheme cytochrome c subunit
VIENKEVIGISEKMQVRLKVVQTTTYCISIFAEKQLTNPVEVMYKLSNRKGVDVYICCEQIIVPLVKMSLIQEKSQRNNVVPFPIPTLLSTGTGDVKFTEWTRKSRVWPC